MHGQQNVKTLHVSDSSSVHHQEFFTVRTAMVNVIKVFLTACKQTVNHKGFFTVRAAMVYVIQIFLSAS
jgi:hypothetical protein